MCDMISVSAAGPEQLLGPSHFRGQMNCQSRDFTAIFQMHFLEESVFGFENSKCGALAHLHCFCFSVRSLNGWCSCFRRSGASTKNSGTLRKYIEQICNNNGATPLIAQPYVLLCETSKQPSMPKLRQSTCMRAQWEDTITWLKSLWLFEVSLIQSCCYA